MAIKSYLVHPHDGKKIELLEILSSFDNCEVIPAENRNVIILVTETKSNFEEAQLKEKLDALNSLKLMAMVSGFNSPTNN